MLTFCSIGSGANAKTHELADFFVVCFRGGGAVEEANVDVRQVENLQALQRSRSKKTVGSVGQQLA